MRWLLVSAPLFLLGIGYALLEGERAGLFGREVGAGLFAAALLAVFVVLFVAIARRLEHFAAARREGEERERGIVEIALDCIVTIDEQGRILDLNPAAERTFGFRREQAVGREMAGLIIPPSLREQHRRSLARCVATGESELLGRRLELTGLRADGSEFPVELTISRLRHSRPPSFVGHLRDISERKRLEDERAAVARELREANERLRSLICASPLAIIATDRASPPGNVLIWNPAAERLFGWREEEALGRPNPIAEGRLEDALALRAQVLAGAEVANVEKTRLRKDGSLVEVAIFSAPLRNEAGEIDGVMAMFEDTSTRKRLEAQLRQAQKMEAVGQLAGGIAHDFNNLLTVIGGFAAMAKRRAGIGPGAAQLDEIEHAAERAAQLTRQLLAFSRQQVLAPAELDLNDVVNGLMPMLSRLIGEHIQIGVLAGRDLPAVLADRGQLELVILNLTVNARDAMPQGGTLTIETRTIELDDDYAREHAGVQPGRYVCLTITDSGTGIDAAIREHLFEPFFTTKPPGEGTGLGLATVYGIVTQSGGHIQVYSEPGLGSSFKAFLPALSGKAAAATTTTPERPIEHLAGSETILLCEDEDAVRRYIDVVLTNHGYTVLAASHPTEALQLAHAATPRIDLLLTDVVMPGMSGPQLAQQLHQLQPTLHVIFLSGYAATSLSPENLPAPSAFLEKPFQANTLLTLIRTLLDAPPTQPTPHATGAEAAPDDHATA